MNIVAEIKALLDSDISVYRIAKDSGVSQSVVNKLRKGDRSIDNLGVGSAQKLIDYWQKVKHNK